VACIGVAARGAVTGSQVAAHPSRAGRARQRTRSTASRGLATPAGPSLARRPGGGDCCRSVLVPRRLPRVPFAFCGAPLHHLRHVLPGGPRCTSRRGQPGLVIRGTAHARSATADDGLLLYHGAYDYLRAHSTTWRLDAGMYLAAVRSFHLAGDLTARCACPVLGVQEPTRLPVAALVQALDAKTGYVLVSLGLLRSIDPPSAELSRSDVRGRVADRRTCASDRTPAPALPVTHIGCARVPATVSHQKGGTPRVKD
jgi:hypothetical protein